MSKIVSVKANSQEIAAVKCICHQICTKWLLWRQMLRKLLLENAFDVKYVQNHHFAGLSMVFFPSCDICICKCSPWEFSDKCDQVLYYCSFLHLQCSHSCTLKIHIAVEEITEDRKVRNLFNYVCHHTRTYIEICMPVDDFWVANM